MAKAQNMNEEKIVLTLNKLENFGWELFDIKNQLETNIVTLDALEHIARTAPERIQLYFLKYFDHAHEQQQRLVKRLDQIGLYLVESGSEHEIQAMRRAKG